MMQFKSTVDVRLIQQMGDDAVIAAAAWVSAIRSGKLNWRQARARAF